METINKTASELITDIDRHFAEICRERGISVEKSEQAESQLKENSNMSVFVLFFFIFVLFQSWGAMRGAGPGAAGGRGRKIASSISTKIC